MPTPVPGAATRIGVLTFHRCINYGSYWQARCLVEGLRARGHDAALLDHESAAVNRAEWRVRARPALPVRSSPTDRAAYLAKTRKFLAAIAALPRSPRFDLDRPTKADAYDIVIVGSDEVWNLRHPWYGGAPIFYGEGLQAERLVSYAASFGNQDRADGLERHWADKLDNFAHISVRDDNSHKLVHGATGRDAPHRAGSVPAVPAGAALPPRCRAQLLHSGAMATAFRAGSDRRCDALRTGVGSASSASAIITTGPTSSASPQARRSSPS